MEAGPKEKKKEVIQQEFPKPLIDDFEKSFVMKIPRDSPILVHNSPNGWITLLPKYFILKIINTIYDNIIWNIYCPEQFFRRIPLFKFIADPLDEKSLSSYNLMQLQWSTVFPNKWSLYLWTQLMTVYFWTYFSGTWFSKVLPCFRP